VDILVWVWIELKKSTTESTLLYRPLLASGLLIMAFGIGCILIGSIINLEEKGMGSAFIIVGWRFLVGGIVSISMAFISRYFGFISKYIKYLSKKVRKTNKNNFDDWYQP
jgi:hypothetical protein